MSQIGNKNKELVKGTLIYAIGSFGSKVLSLLIVPLYTFFIVPEELGNYDLILTTVNLLIPIITLQITDAAYKWIVENLQKKDQIISCTYWILFISSIFSLLLSFTIGIMALGFVYAFFLELMLLSQMWLTSLQKLLRALKKQKIFVAAGLFQTFWFLIGTIVLVCLLRFEVSGLCWAYILAHIFAIIFIFVKCPQLFVRRIGYEKEYFGKMMKFSVPLIPNAMSWWMINSSDKYIIRILLGAASNGIYSVSSKFPAALQTVNSLFYSAWQDVAIREKAGEERDQFYTKTFESYYSLMFGLVLVMIPATRVFLPVIVGKEYETAALYSGFIYLGMVFQGFSSFYGINYLNSNKTVGATFTSIIATIVNLVIDLILMPFIGLYAAGLSTFIGFTIMWIIRVFQTKKITNIKIKKVKFTLYFVAALGMAIVCISLSRILCFILTIIFGILFLFLQRKLIWNILKKKFI